MILVLTSQLLDSFFEPQGREEARQGQGAPGAR